MSGAAAADWTIRPIEKIDEYHACEDLQRQAWGFSGDLDIIPLTQMMAARKAGGVVLGAFTSEDRLIGFCYGFVGLRPTGELLHYSHMLAVDPKARTAGLGAALKWAQRDAVLEQGIEWMLWTYDPLESLNAYLNFTKLGVIARTYWTDLYGQTSSGLHQGTATDRLLAEWPLAARRVAHRAAGAARPRVPDGATPLLVARQGGKWLEPDQSAGIDGSAALTLEIPPNVQEIKADSPELARAWRAATRAAFTNALDSGYHVAECLRRDGKTVYLLRLGEFEDETDH